MENDKKGLPESRKKATKNYKKGHYDRIYIETKTQYIEDIKKFCQNMGVTRTEFIIRCCNYFIDRKELPPE